MSSAFAESVGTGSAAVAPADAAAVAGGARRAVGGQLPQETLLGPLGRAGSSERGCPLRRRCVKPSSSPKQPSARAEKRHF